MFVSVDWGRVFNFQLFLLFPSASARSSAILETWGALYIVHNDISCRARGQYAVRILFDYYHTFRDYIKNIANLFYCFKTKNDNIEVPRLSTDVRYWLLQFNFWYSFRVTQKLYLSRIEIQWLSLVRKIVW